MKSILVRNEGHFRQAMHLAQEAGEFLSDDEPAMRAAAFLQTANNLLRLGDLNQVERATLQARQLLEPVRQKSPNMLIQALQMHSWAAISRADFHHALRLYHRGLDLAAELSVTPPMVGVLYAGLGTVHYEWDELDAAAIAFGQARQWAEDTAISDITVAALLGELDLLCQQGDAAGVEERSAHLRHFAAGNRLPHVVHQVKSAIAHYHRRLGDLEEAVRWADTSGFQLDDRPPSSQREFYLTLIAVRLDQCKAAATTVPPALPGLIQYLHQQASANGFRLDQIRLLIFQALVFDYQEQRDTARQVLAKALDLARPGDLVRTFLDSDPALELLLAQIDDPYGYLSDKNNWVPQTVVTGLFARLVNSLGDRDRIELR